MLEDDTELTGIETGDPNRHGVFVGRGPGGGFVHLLAHGRGYGLRKLNSGQLRHLARAMLQSADDLDEQADEAGADMEAQLAAITGERRA